MTSGRTNVKGFQIDGIVVDAATQRPVPHAHVIIQLDARVGMSELYHVYGVVANERGEFVANLLTSVATHRRIYVDAAGPEGMIGRSAAVAEVVDGYLRDTVNVRLGPQTDAMKDKTRYQYDTFGEQNCGVTFLDKGWNQKA